jgi:iron complex outermembrane recepter protein
MRLHSKLSCAIAAILGGGASGNALSANPTDTGSAANSGGDQIQEIVVTAQRRSENIENVPISIQALTGETLSQLNVTNFDDLVKYLPNVSASSNGPGQSQIFMRGLSVGDQGTQSGGSINGFPNVAIYLDEQSGQLPGRNLDVYAADLERVEVLEGPQGTLFGAGAQAGVIRYITNKPKLDVTEGSVTAGYGVTAGGDPNADVTAVINLPLVADTLAIRGVIYDDHRGGYINNVPGTFTRKDTDIGIHYAGYPATGGACPDGGANSGYCVPPGSPSINNASTVGNAINPVTYEGIRVSALWDIHNDWNALLTQSYQSIDAQGVFYEMPKSSDGVPLPPQSVTLFNPSYNNDKFENTALTVTGRIGDLKLVYAGAYLVRNISQVQDYTNYSRGKYADYYQCHGADHGLAPTCYSPSATWNETERNTHQSHELRLSTPDDWRLRGIIGAFWEELQIDDQLNWLYKTLPPCTTTASVGCLTDLATVPGTSVNNPGARGDNVSFFNDVQRGYRQTAVFTSLYFDLIPNVLTFTAGTRYYRFVNDEKGTVAGSFFCYDAGPAPCYASATSIDGENLHSTYQGAKSLGSLTWHFLPDAMVYATWSQGFRPGAFNRNNGFGTNGPSYRIHGVETSFIAVLAEGLTAQGGASWNTSRQTNSPYLIANNPALLKNPLSAAEYGKPIYDVDNPYGPAGGPSANSPPLQFNVRMRYQWTMNSYNSFVQAGATHTAHSFTQSSVNPTLSSGSNVSTTLLRFEDPPISQFDASCGVAKDAWTAEFYAQNLTNVIKSTYTSTNQFVPAETITRPRVLGVRFGYKF